MAKITPSALINEIKGSLNNSTFRTNRSGIHFYPKTKPQNARSEKQVQTRINFNYITSLWKNLSQTQRALWDRYASLLPKPSSGINAFTSLNGNILNSNYIGLSCVSNPPFSPDTPPPITGFFVKGYDASSNTLYWASPDDNNSYLKCSVSRIYGSKSNWQRFGTIRSTAKTATHTHNYQAKTVITYKARSILPDGRQGPFSYTPNLELPIEVMVMSDGGNGRLKMLYLNPLSFASQRFNDNISGFLFDFPWGVLYHKVSFYVVDYNQSTIYRLNPSTFAVMRTYTGAGQPANYQLINPKGITASNTSIYVVSKDNSLLKLFYSTLTPLTSYNSPVGGDPVFANIRDVCLHDSDLFVTHRLASCGFSIFNTSLQYITSYGSFGTGDGQFSDPYGVFVDDSYIYICDGGNNRISVWNRDPITFSYHITALTGDPLSLDAPCACIVHGDYIYISDFGNARIVKAHKTTLEYISSFGTYGDGLNECRGAWGITLWQE